MKPLQEQLNQLGIAKPTQDCSFITVSVEQEGQLLHLVMSDSLGRHAERRVMELATAASIIASWAEPTRTTLSAQPAQSPQRDSPAGPTRPPQRSRAKVLSILLGSAVDTNNRVWAGASGAACLSLGIFCVGVQARVSDSFVYSKSDRRYPQLMGGLAYDFLALARWPNGFGLWSVEPELNLGYGVVQFDWAYELGPWSENKATSLRGLRVGTTLRVSRRVARGYALELTLSADLLPGSYLRHNSPLPPQRASGMNGMIRGAVGVRFGT